MIHLKYPLVLGSASPRRQLLLKQAGLTFRIIKTDIDESVAEKMTPARAAIALAEKKANACRPELRDEMALTADTIVVVDEMILGKPAGLPEAAGMLRRLSGKTHQVITGICLLVEGSLYSEVDITDVSFKMLSEDQIGYYVANYRPMDKAGAYGIQEWIGLTGIASIRGSYFNVMGLPVHRVFNMMQDLNLLHYTVSPLTDN